MARRSLLAALTTAVAAVATAVATPAATPAAAAAAKPVPAVRLSVATGPPTTSTTVKVSGFAAREAVELSFGTSTVRTLVTGSTGAAQATVAVPASAAPGAQSFVAVGRRSGNAAQAVFTVRTDVTHVGFDNGHTGANPYENRISPTTVARAKLAWRTVLPSSSTATPAVVGGVVYESFGDGTVRAFTASTGKQKWSFATGGGTSFSSPAVVGGVVYVGASNKKFYALTATTGAKKWSYTVGDLVYSSPVVVGTSVYFGSYDQSVYALNTANGSLRWKHTTSAAVYSAPTYADGKIFIGSFDNTATALNAKTGAVVWTVDVGGLMLAPVVVADGLAFAAAEGHLYALDEETGTVEWTTTSAADAAGYDSGTLFVPTTNGVLNAYDAATGTVLWSRTLGSAALRQPVAIANGVVFVGLDHTYAVRASDGTLLRTFSPGGTYGGVTVSDGTITLANSRTNTLARYVLPASVTAAPAPNTRS